LSHFPEIIGDVSRARVLLEEDMQFGKTRRRQGYLVQGWFRFPKCGLEFLTLVPEEVAVDDEQGAKRVGEI
jgi:hypothetical protein